MTNNTENPIVRKDNGFPFQAFKRKDGTMGYMNSFNNGTIIADGLKWVELYGDLTDLKEGDKKYQATIAVGFERFDGTKGWLSQDGSIIAAGKVKSIGSFKNQYIAKFERLDGSVGYVNHRGQVVDVDGNEDWDNLREMKNY